MFFFVKKEEGVRRIKLFDFVLLFAARYLKQILAAPRNEFVARTISRLTTVFVVVDKFPLFPCNLVEEKYQAVSHLVLQLFLNLQVNHTSI